MNMGYEDDELKPYQEAQPDLNDQKRIGKTGTVQQHWKHFHWEFLVVHNGMIVVLPKFISFF